MSWKHSDQPAWVERIVAALCYLTGGIAGIIYIIISRSSYQSQFFRFHFLQSIILVIISFLLNFAFKAIPFMVGPLIPFLSSSMGMAGEAIYNLISNGIMIFFLLYSLIPIYGLIFALLGKSAEIPVISKVVRNQMR